MGFLDSLGDVAGQVGGVFKGAGEALWETGKGVVDLGVGVAKTAYDTSPAGLAITGATNFYERATGNELDLPEWLPSAERGADRLAAAADIVGTIADDPGLLVDAIVDPIVDDWNNGNYGEAIGRGAIEVLGVVVGAKGVDKVGRTARIADAAGDAGRATRAADTAGDAARAGRAADGADTAGDVAHVGRAAKAMEAATRYRRAVTTGDDAAAATAAREVAELSTHRSGTADRVVLGKWEADGGYVAEARRHGGTWFETAPDVYDEFTRGMTRDDARQAAWRVNEEFLESQLERGVSRIELTGESIQEVLTNRPNSFTAMEIDYLHRNAAKYGYVREGNAWVKQGQTNAG